MINLIAIYSCSSGTDQNQTDLRSPQNADESLAVIEIPSGSIEKWEMNKKSGEIERDLKNGKPRTIEYLGYPANYGYIPNTLLSKDDGGDGDPLDIIVIGPQAERGDSLRVHILGVLRLLDRGEQDDKLIALSKEASLQDVNDIDDLENNYPGILSIIETWFEHYKGVGTMLSQGYGNREEALKILDQSRIETPRH